MQRKNGIAEFCRGDILACRNELFGLTAIWIVLFHVYGHIWIGNFPGSFWVANFLSMGNSGVDIFLLLSAIGLYASMEKNSAGTFYKNRFLRVAVPFLLTVVPYFLWFDLLYQKDGFVQFLLNISTLNFWLTNKYPVWYVAFIAVVYMLYPVLHRLDKRTSHISTVVLIVAAVIFEYICFRSGSIIYTNSEKALSRIPVFLCGILMAPHLLKRADLKISLYWIVAAFVVWVCTFYVLSMYSFHLIVIRYLYGVMSICFVVLFSWIRKQLPCKPLNKLLAWAGTRSLEIYVTHVLLLRIVGYHDLWELELTRSLWYIFVIAMAAVLAEVVFCFAKRIKARRNI